MSKKSSRSNLISKLKKLFKPKKKLVILPIRGAIGMSGSRSTGSVSFSELRKLMDNAFSTTNAKAVLIALNSPGGSPVQSELICNALRIRSIKNKIPIFIFVEEIAASGGYWIACAGEKIYASNNSIVGSIGVISAGFGFKKLINKYGIERRIYTQGADKAFMDPFSDENQKDVKRLERLQKSTFDVFVEHVKTSRASKLKDNKKLFTGDFWTGKQALQLGLIDEIYTMEQWIYDNYGKDIKLIYCEKPKSWLKEKMGLSLDRLINSLGNQITEYINNTSLWSRFGL